MSGQQEDWEQLPAPQTPGAVSGRTPGPSGLQLSHLERDAGGVPSLLRLKSLPGCCQSRNQSR